MNPVTGGRRELVWRNGVNETDLGAMIWNDRARKSVMDIYRKRGNPILIDINHNYNEELRRGWESRGEPAPTGGNAALELDAQGNLLIVPDWSTYARAKIDGKELRFLSPDFAYDKKTREITEIYRISLVAEPGTWHARMVASAKRKGRLTMGISAELIAAITEMANLMAAEQVSDALKEAVNKVVALAGGEGPMAEPMEEPLAANPKDPMDPNKPDAIVQKNMTLARKYSADSATLAARRLCVEMRTDARTELALNPAEEAELLKINAPDELTRAIGLLRASRTKTDAAKGKLGREAAIENRNGAEPPKPTGNPYLDVMNKYGLGVAQ